MVKKAYISGPITGMEYENAAAFGMASAIVKHYGMESLNPLHIMHGDGTHKNPAYTHDDYIREDIRLGLSKCDVIVLIPGWQHSKGACKELEWAQEHGLEILLQVDEKLVDADMLPIPSPSTALPLNVSLARAYMS